MKCGRCDWARGKVGTRWPFPPILTQHDINTSFPVLCETLAGRQGGLLNEPGLALVKISNTGGKFGTVTT